MKRFGFSKMAKIALAGLVYTAPVTMALSTISVVHAETASIYVYVGKIDEKAKNPVDGQKLGVLKAKIGGLKSLLEKMVPVARHNDLPKLDKDVIDQFVRAISFENERFGGGRYLADLRVEYDEEQVRSFLQRERIPFAEMRAPKILVVPVLQKQNVSQLWENSNTWKSKWQEGEIMGGLVPILVPDNGFSNWTVITPEQALEGEHDRLQALTRKYNADGVLVAVARVSEDKGKTKLEVDLATYVLGLEGWRKTVYSEIFEKDFLMENLQVAKEMVVLEVAEEWKRRNLLPFDQEMSNLHATLFINGIKDWVGIHTSLKKVLNIRSTHLKSMSIEKVGLQVNYLGSIEQLRTALEQAGLILNYESSVGGWALRRK